MAISIIAGCCCEESGDPVLPCECNLPKKNLHLSLKLGVHNECSDNPADPTEWADAETSMVFFDKPLRITNCESSSSEVSPAHWYGAICYRIIATNPARYSSHNFYLGCQDNVVRLWGNDDPNLSTEEASCGDCRRFYFDAPWHFEFYRQTEDYGCAGSNNMVIQKRTIISCSPLHIIWEGSFSFSGVAFVATLTEEDNDDLL